VPAGASQQFTIVVHVSPSAADGSTLSNPATVTTTTPQLTTQNDSATETTGVSTRADLVTAITGKPNPVAPGARITYDLVLGNAGAVDAHDVTITDTPGAGASLVSLAQVGGPQFACADGACTIANLPSRTIARFTVVARTDPASGGTFVLNTAAALTSTPETSTANNDATAAVAVARIGPDLAFRYAVHPRVVRQGSLALITIKVVNKGNAPATAVTLTETLPRRLGYVGKKAANASCRLRRPRLVCSLHTIKAHATRTVKVTVLAARVGRLKVRAVASSGQPDLNAANNAMTARIRVRR
jgi:uncharacterized repeat protein (TIGR01451 family)